MEEKRKEKLLNKMYYTYLEREEAQEIIDYIIKLEKELEKKCKKKKKK